jgi:hypothetical protein
MMLEELQRRNYSQTTVNSYLRIVEVFAKHFGRSLNQLGRNGYAPIRYTCVAGGHGAVQNGQQRMTGQRNYIEELGAKVDAGKKAGQSLTEIQKAMPIVSIKALQADGLAGTCGP